MKEQMRATLDLFAQEGLIGSAAVMEMFRFRALDQIISSHAETREWGVTVDKLYQLAETATTETFGPLPYTQDGFAKLYGPSFAVDPFEIISETGYIDGMDAGKHWQVPLQEVLKEHETTDGVILFAFIEEYAGQVETILQTLPADRVILHTSSESCYEILSRLYPLASITMEWPEDVVFDHVVAASSGMFQPPSYVIEQMASRVGNVTEQGTLHYFVPLACIQDQKGIHKVSLQYLLLQNQLKAIREWVPTGCYEFVFGAEAVKKVSLEIREVIDNETWRTTPLIALPGKLLASMEVFTLVDYALSLFSKPMVADAKQVSLGDDGYLSTDTRLPDYMKKVFNHAGTARLTVMEMPTAMEIGTSEVSGPDIDTVLRTPEILAGIGEEETPTTLYWQFENPVAQYIWYSYFHSAEGQEVLRHLSQLVTTPAGFYQLMGSCRRNYRTPEELHEIAKAFTAGKTTYEETVQQAELAWKEMYQRIAAAVMPARDETNRSVDSDEEPMCTGGCASCATPCEPGE